mgnify:CR=1 FL=1
MKEEKSFEELIEDLENIAELLESDKLNLDKSMAKFEEGMKISKLCTEKIENAEKKIKYEETIPISPTAWRMYAPDNFRGQQLCFGE